MAVYTYRAYDLMTGRFLMDLPVTSGSFTDALNDPGSADLTVAMSYRVMQLVGGAYVDPGYLLNGFNWDIDALLQATIPTRTALYIDRDGDLVWGGIIWTRRPARDGMQITASGFLSYFDKRRIRQDFDQLGTEQCTIARTLLLYALGVTRNGRRVGDIGMTIVSPVTPIIRDSLITGSDRKGVLETVMGLVNLSSGFDIGVDVAYDPATRRPAKTLTMWFPSKGRSAANSPIFWEYEAGTDVSGGTLSAYDWPEDGTRTLTLALGRGDQTDFPVLSEQWADDMLNLGYPLLEDEQTWSNDIAIEDQDTLDEHTRAVLAVRGGLVTTPSVTLRPGVDPGDYQIGDWARVAITDPVRFPARVPGAPGTEETVRIIGRTVTPPLGDGNETTTVQLHTITAEQERFV